MPAHKPLNPEPYEIHRPTGCCAATGTQLEPGAPYIATLVESPQISATSPPPQADEAAGPNNTSTPKQPQPNANPLPLFQRVDISIDAWESGHRPDRLFSYWRSVVPEPNRKKRLFVDDEVLIDLFERLADADDPDKIAFRFVLGLILMRKKRLRYDGHDTKPGPDGTDREWWRMTLLPARGKQHNHTSPDDTRKQFELLDPKLDEAQIQEVAEQLGQILDMEL